MSVMIAVRHNGRIALAADSLWASGWDAARHVRPKIERRGDTLVTVGPSCGHSHALQREVFRFIDECDGGWPERWPEYCLSREDTHPLRRMAADDDKSAPIIVVWQGRMFKLWCDGGLSDRADPVIAIGCGAGFATGAAHAFLRTHKSARAVALKAAEVACELSIGCGPPIICESVNAA